VSIATTIPPFGPRVKLDQLQQALLHIEKSINPLLKDARASQEMVRRVSLPV